MINYDYDQSVTKDVENDIGPTPSTAYSAKTSTGSKDKRELRARTLQEILADSETESDMPELSSSSESDSEKAKSRNRDKIPATR